jgi:hypothetical protein
MVLATNPYPPLDQPEGYFHPVPFSSPEPPLHTSERTVLIERKTLSHLLNTK